MASAFIGEEIRVISTDAAGSAGIFARRIPTQVKTL